MVQRPDHTEFQEYYGLYVDQVPEGDVLELFRSEFEVTRSLLDAVPSERETHRYAEGKWSIREVVGHVLDVERTFGYRALFIARGDPGELPSMDQDVWSDSAGYHERPLVDIVDELALVREGHVLMFQSFAADAWRRSGVASGVSFTARSLPFIILGHEIHHRTILEERYGVGGDA